MHRADQYRASHNHTSIIKISMWSPRIAYRINTFKYKEGCNKLSVNPWKILTMDKIATPHVLQEVISRATAWRGSAGFGAGLELVHQENSLRVFIQAFRWSEQKGGKKDRWQIRCHTPQPLQEGRWQTRLHPSEFFHSLSGSPSKWPCMILWQWNKLETIVSENKMKSMRLVRLT